MDSERKKYAEFVGVVAVVASLIFVAFEIRQSNQIARGTTAFEIMNAYRESNHLLATNSELLSLFGRRRGGEELNQMESQQFGLFVVGTMNVWVATEEAFDNGIVSDRLFRTYISDVTNNFSLLPPEQWELMVEGMPQFQDFEFHRIISELLESQKTQ